MLDKLRHVLRLRRREDRHEELQPVVVQAERKQQQQFDAWRDTLKEVQRVQRTSGRRH